MMQIDHGAVTTLAPLMLVDFIVAKLKQDRVHLRNADELTLGLITDNKVSKKLTNGKRTLKVKSNHSSRVYIVRGLDTVPCSKAMFFDKEAGRDRSVADWFAEHHPKYKLRRPDLPCILAGKAADPGALKIPLELLKLEEAQPPEATQGEIAQAMIKECAIVPSERFPLIKDIARDYENHVVGVDDTSIQESCERFGSFTLDSGSAIEVEARVLAPCQVVYRSRNEEKVRVAPHANPPGRNSSQRAPLLISVALPAILQQVVTPFADKGSWNLANGLSYITPASCAGWAIVVCMRLESQENAFPVFEREFENMARERKIDLGRCDLGTGPKCPLEPSFINHWHPNQHPQYICMPGT